MSERTSEGTTCLHLVAGPGAEALATCLANCQGGDALLFLDAGVLQLLRGETPVLQAAGHRLYFLAADLAARGLVPTASGAGCEIVDDARFVDLLRQHAHCVTWT